MNKKLAFLLVLIFNVTIIFAQNAKTLYISPNNDGIQDELEIPLSIKDKRYITEWALVIQDSNGNVVRTIGNKEKRPETITFKSFWQSLFSKKEGVVVPESVIWNGVLDSGEVAPDGKYFYFVTATDDNGNTAKTALYEITVDNTEPFTEVVQPSESAKIFGGGGRPSITIKQSGSVEDLWIGQIQDVNGNTVRTWKWENSEPLTLEWDGKDDYGASVADGVYSYSLTSTDRAGNVSESKTVANIIFDPIPRSVNMSLKESPFSPNGDGVKDKLTIIPVMSNSNGLQNWEILVLDKNGSQVRIWNGTSDAPIQFDFDGKDKNGFVLNDGDYQLKYIAKYSNGQESVISRNFTIDNIAPKASVRTDLTIFSPDGDGRSDFISIYQEASKEKAWFGEILDNNGKIVKSYEYGEIPPASFTWDGVGNNNAITDGFYTYKLYATDLAGNTGIAQTATFELNTGTTELLLSVSEEAFSPNGDKVKDTILFTPQVKSSSVIVAYKLSIYDEANTLVKTFEDKRALPKSFSWNGTDNSGNICKDGFYYANLYTLSKNDKETNVSTRTFELDTVYPSITASTQYLIFSPNGDGKKDTLPLSIVSSSETLWTGKIVSSSKETVRTYSWNESVPSFEWDGTDENGNLVDDGKYSFSVTSTDKAGNSTLVTISDIQLDTVATKAFLTAELDAISPNSDGVKDEQIFSIIVSPASGVKYWKFAILEAGTSSGASGVGASGVGAANAMGKEIRSWSSNDGYKDVPSSIKWNGADANGRIAEGTLVGNLYIEYEKGDEINVQTSNFVCSVTPPQISANIRTDSSTEYFSPDNDGYADDLYIMLGGKGAVPFASWSFNVNDPQNGKTFWKVSGKSTITERMIWDGRSNSGELVQSATDYPFTFTVTDELGLTSTVTGIIPVDVLVIRSGDKLKIQVPSIIFRSDAADFVGKDVDPRNGLDKDKIDNNNRVLKRIAEILNKFKDYNVTIEGHANNVSGTETEETQDTAMYGKALVPLSEARAKYVKDSLIKFGVDSSRLSTVGFGGRQPVVSREDKDNWWKNRRVEFILNK